MTFLNVRYNYTVIDLVANQMTLGWGGVCRRNLQTGY